MAKIERACLVCNTLFETSLSLIKRGKGKYCSHKCYSISISNKIECVCEQCGTHFSLTPSKIENGEGKYCSPECRHPAHYINCLNCNIKFRIRPSDIGRNRKFCSKACEHARIQKQCCVCGSEYSVHRCNSSSKYCSRECFDNRPSNKIEKRCAYCDVTYLARRSQVMSGKALYCSKNCQSKALSLKQRGSNSPFWRGGHSKYRGENWKEQRRLAYDRDGGACQICHSVPSKGQRKNAVHHIKPARCFNGDWQSANDLSNLITLCHQCHPKVEYGGLPVPVRLF